MNIMRAFVSCCFVGVPVLSAGTINVDDRHAYGANIGWLDLRADGSPGAALGQFYATGHVWSANAGWINLGNGPTNGYAYSNATADDWGVNHDGEGNLRGFAWGANIGWIQFEAMGAPKINLLSGRLDGYVWSANVGWIGLSNAQAFVRTDRLDAGPDTDGDGIPDAWEIIHYGDPTGADAESVAANGVHTVREMYLAGLNPNKPDQALRIVRIDHDGKYSYVEWTSVPSRLYGLEYAGALTRHTVWTDAFGPVTPDAGLTTLRTLLTPHETGLYYRVRATLPLTP